MDWCISYTTLLYAAALMLAGSLRTARGELLGEGWPWRRPINFKQAVSDAPGDNVAWAEFYANGQQKADGADIRVTAADRTVMPLKLLQVSRDNDLVRVAFATKGDGPYYVWWGNAKAEKPAKDLELKRGLLLEVSRYAGPAGAGPAALTALAAPGPVMASYLLPDVSLGYNPFGEERQILLHYTGAFKIDRAITAQIAFTVNDMGILTIDGKEVDRQIKVGLRGLVRQSEPLTLAAGWHSLDIKQVNQAAPNVVMALAWQRPGEKVFTPFPGTIFAPVARGLAGGLEKVGPAGGAAMTDIEVEAVAEGFLPPGFYGQRYVFEVMYPAAFKPTILWDFGDGQTFAGLKRMSHIFLGPGVYPVTVRLLGVADGTAGGVPTTTVRLAVKDRMYEKFPRPPEDPAATMKSVLRDYKPEKLPGDQAFRGMMFWESAGDVEGQVSWGKAWLAGSAGVVGGGVADASVFEETFALARLEIGRKEFKGAAESFKLAAGKAAAMDVRANLMRHEVMTLCDYVDDVDAAVKEAQDWLKKINATNKPQVQTVQAALAYALLAKGDGKGAKAAVDAAVAAMGSAPVPTGRAGGVTAVDAYNQMEIRQGVLTRNVENYIRTKDLDTALTLLNQWELEFPESIWDGFTRTLRVKVAAAEGRNLVAARIAVAHARANPDGFYAAELLYRAAEQFKLGGEQQQAKTVMDLLAGKYPESPYAREAGK